MSDLAITNVTVVDCSRESARAPVGVRVERGLITEIRPMAAFALRDGEASVDGTGKYLIPGLWETHAHICEQGGRLRPPWYSRPEEATPVVADSLRTYLRHGITSVVDLGGRADILAATRIAQESGQIVGSRLFYCGGHFNWTGGAFVSPWMNRLVGTLGDARSEVDRAVAEEGIDLVKIVYSRGLPAWDGFPKLSPEVFRAIVTRAHDHGIPAAIHGDSAADMLEAASVGVDSCEHMFHPVGKGWRDDRARVFEALLANGSYFPLTIVLFEMEAHARDEAWLHERGADVAESTVSEAEAHPESMWRCFPSEDKEDAQRRFEAAMETAAELHRAGVLSTISTDSGVSAIFHGVSTHREMELHEEAGVPPEAILRMATLNAANKLRVGDRYGTVEEGKVADLVLLDADPRKTVKNLRRITALIQGGTLLRPEDLN